MRGAWIAREYRPGRGTCTTSQCGCLACFRSAAAVALASVKRRPTAVLILLTAACGGGGTATIITSAPISPEAHPQVAVVEGASSVQASPSASAAPASSCAERCSGRGTADLVTFATQRAARTKACYDTALAADRTLRGKMEVLVRITDTGAVCDTRVVASELPAAVGQCVARILGGVDYPAPRGGCLDVTVPLSFEPRDADGGALSP